MVAVPLFAEARKRDIAKLPYGRATNMLIEKDESNLIDGVVRLQRPALSAFRNMPLSPNRGINRVDDTFGGVWFVVNGTKVYTVAFNGSSHTEIGTVPAGGLVQIIIGRGRVLFIAEGNVYSWDGVSFTTVTIPDGQSVAAGAFINGYFLLAISGSDRYYWIAPGETNPDALSYATAERKADNLLGIDILGDEVWLWGGDGAEVWFPTVDPDAPFQRANSRVYEKGIVNRDCTQLCDNTLFSIASDRVIYRFTPQPQRVSTNAIEEQLRLAASAEMSMWSFNHTGHDVLVVNLNTYGTWAYDASTGLWSRFQSYNQSNWRAITGFSSENVTICGDQNESQIWFLDNTSSLDAGTPFVRELVGSVEVLGKPQPCDSFSVKCAVGWAPTPDFEPEIAVCFSDDQGATWSDWEYMGLGKQGQYQGEACLRQLGLIEAPGRLFWLRMTDNALFRINYARMNEAWGW